MSGPSAEGPTAAPVPCTREFDHTPHQYQMYGVPDVWFACPGRDPSDEQCDRLAAMVAGTAPSAAGEAAPTAEEQWREFGREMREHPRRDVIEALAEATSEVSDELDAGMRWHLRQAYAVVEMLPALILEEGWDDQTKHGPWIQVPPSAASEAGAVLGEEAVGQLADVLHRRGCEDDSCQGICYEDAQALAPHVAALVAAAEARGAAKRGTDEWAVRFQAEGHEFYSHFPVADEAQAWRHAVSTPQRRAWVVRRTVTDWEESS